jgi:hypothetical protein
MAVPATTINTAHPRNSHTRADWQFGCGAFDHFPHDLMPRNDLRFKRRQIFFDNVEIGPAHAAGSDAKQNMSGLRFGGTRDVLDMDEFPRRFISRSLISRSKDGSFHLTSFILISELDAVIFEKVSKRENLLPTANLAFLAVSELQNGRIRQSGNPHQSALEPN